MLVGYGHRETWQRVFHRFNRMVERGVLPYPMVYGERERTLPLGTYQGRIEHRTLGDFQRWAIRRLYRIFPFEQYDVTARRHSVGCKPRVVLGSREIGIDGGKAGPGRGKKTGSNTTRFSRDRSYILARLDRDRPDLADMVRVRKLTANSAAIAAGFRRKHTPFETVKRLWPKLTTDEQAQVKGGTND
jgi:hypothetical protein